MYARHSEIYDQVHTFKDYASEVQSLLRLIDKQHPTARTLLDVACGTGIHLELLQGRFEVSGLDINPALLAQAAERVPGARLHACDMESFNLDQSFDVVTCLFGAVTYLVTPARLARALASMAHHVNPGGLLIVEPWLTLANYRRNNIKLDVSESDEGKIARMYVGREEGGVVTNEEHFLIGTPAGVTHMVETNLQGLFDEIEFTGPFAVAGLDLVEHDPVGLHGYGLYIAQRPPS
jgi:SAM-dependent methyltransferase